MTALCPAAAQSPSTFHVAVTPIGGTKLYPPTLHSRGAPGASASLSLSTASVLGVFGVSSHKHMPHSSRCMLLYNMHDS